MVADTWTQFKAAVARGGERKGMLEVDENFAGNCHNPIPFHVWGCAGKDWRGHQVPSHAINRRFRCRKCNNCLHNAKCNWQNRASHEFGAALRVWFVTFTYHPMAQIQLGLRAFGEPLLQACQIDLTKFLKRLRKKHQFRYLFVTEVHKSGVPHFHGLLFERSVITKRVIQEKWKLGFSKVSLAKTIGSSGYMLKYVLKDPNTRVRASVGFGETLLPNSDYISKVLTTPMDETWENLDFNPLPDVGVAEPEHLR